MRLRNILFAIAGSGCGFSTSVSPIVDATPDMLDAPTAPVCLENRCRKKTITIDHARVVGGPLLLFPLFVKVADPDLANALPTGVDFAFVMADTPTVPLAYERERFAANELLAWVSIPSLSSATDTTLYLYYGDPAAADTQNRAGVWDADFEAVWHLAETIGGSGAIKDSTQRTNDGTDLGGVTLAATAQLGTGARFDGVDDHIMIPQDPSLTNTASKATLEMWVNWMQAIGTDYQRLLLASNSLAGDGKGMEWATNAMGQYYYYPSNAGGNNYASIASPFTNGSWHHVVMTPDFATKSVAIFVDGVQRTAAQDNTPMDWLALETAADWHWGGAPPRTKFAGMMDEIRVSKIVRSPGWIATEYANQKSPSTFYSVE